ncbi:MAG: LysR substrate-binding domain-containing protein [Pseudomonadota bacterium]
MKTRLPPLNAVRAFHAAARYLNLSRAAEELGVTQSAISKQVIALEDFIGARVFERLPGGLELTGKGKSLRDSIDPAFDLLDTAFIHHSRRPPRSNRCRVSTLASFAATVLAPRMQDFRTRFPDMELDVLTSDRLVDLEREEIDFSIRFGTGEWEDLVSIPLAPGRLIPVCKPGLLGSASVGDDLAGTRRIQMFSSDEWRVWSEKTGREVSDSTEAFFLEDFLVALRMTEEGQGIALLPEPIVADAIVDGRLEVFSDTALDWPQTYHIVHRQAGKPAKRTHEIIDWFLDQAATLTSA